MSLFLNLMFRCENSLCVLEKLPSECEELSDCVNLGIFIYKIIYVLIFLKNFLHCEYPLFVQYITNFSDLYLYGHFQNFANIKNFKHKFLKF